MSNIDLTALTNVFAELVADADTGVFFDRDWNRYLCSREESAKGAAWSELVEGFDVSCETSDAAAVRERLLTIVDAEGRGHTWELRCVFSDDDRYIHVLDLRDSHGDSPALAA
ncbi:hypothetical protein FY136_28565 (plasmid) [Agrobacterium tumefaciens]|uniref:hypothetical protein n=1 Tax=Agrobacterium tumefaciens TaxID=358 RepID=UPI0021D1F261|nr:hypothetical protein [Agrobacterium tumefaciens]UXT53217.1 hypothetical protein FY136_28565 [Agrobacterium tumefaciens]